MGVGSVNYIITKLHVRFDEGVLETGPGNGMRHRRKGESRRTLRLPVPVVAAPAPYSADAEHSGESSPAGLRGGENQRAGHLPGRESARGRAGRSPLPRSLADRLSDDGETAGERSARAAHLLRLSWAPLAQAAHHQCHRALLCGGASSHTPHGLLRQRRERGPHYLCHLQRLQRTARVAEPDPPPFYTSSLTSPSSGLLDIGVIARAV